MTGVEVLEAAIVRLETLKTNSTPGPWKVDGCAGTAYEIYTEAESVLGGTVHTVDDRYPRGDFNQFIDAALIVVLRSTVDPILAILKLAVVYANISPNRYTDAALTLAHAILGDTQ